MGKKIITKGTTGKRIEDVGSRSRRIDPAIVARALGAEGSGTGLELKGGPISLFQLRAVLAERLQSRGGRPALEGANRRVKIPVSERQWRELEELAATLSDQEFSPSAGQVASVLLSLAIPRAKRELKRTHEPDR